MYKLFLDDTNWNLILAEAFSLDTQNEDQKMFLGSKARRQSMADNCTAISEPTV
jgi:hypothetical protein